MSGSRDGIYWGSLQSVIGAASRVEMKIRTAHWPSVTYAHGSPLALNDSAILSCDPPTIYGHC